MSCKTLTKDLEIFPIQSNVMYFLTFLLAMGGAITHKEKRLMLLSLGGMALWTASISTWHHSKPEIKWLSHVDVASAVITSLVFSVVFIVHFWRRDMLFHRVTLWFILFLILVSAYGGYKFVESQLYYDKTTECGQEIYDFQHGVWHLFSGSVGALILAAILFAPGEKQKEGFVVGEKQKEKFVVGEEQNVPMEEF